MPDGENPAMEAVEAPTLQAGVPALPVDTRGFELGEGNHPMLARGEPGNEGINVAVAGFCMHVHA